MTRLRVSVIEAAANTLSVTGAVEGSVEGVASELPQATRENAIKIARVSAKNFFILFSP